MKAFESRKVSRFIAIISHMQNAIIQNISYSYAPLLLKFFIYIEVADERYKLDLDDDEKYNRRNKATYFQYL